MRSEALAASERFGLDRKPFGVVVGALLALKIVALFVIAWNRRFVMDEFVQFGWAKYIPDKIG